MKNNNVRKIGNFVFTDSWRWYFIAENGFHPFYDTVCRGYNKSESNNVRGESWKHI